jgi:hypothetical protein
MPNVRSYDREARDNSRVGRAAVGELRRGRLLQCLDRLHGMQGRRSRVFPLVGNSPGDIAKNLFLQKRPFPNRRIAQGLWRWSSSAVVSDCLNRRCAFMEDAPERAETGTILLGDRGSSREGTFGWRGIKLRAITRWAAHGMTGSVTKDCCPILSAASSRKGWESERLAAGLASHTSRGETARRMGQRKFVGNAGF